MEATNDKIKRDTDSNASSRSGSAGAPPRSRARTRTASPVVRGDGGGAPPLSGTNRDHSATPAESSERQGSAESEESVHTLPSLTSSRSEGDHERQPSTPPDRGSSAEFSENRGTPPPLEPDILEVSFGISGEGGPPMAVINVYNSEGRKWMVEVDVPFSSSWLLTGNHKRFHTDPKRIIIDVLLDKMLDSTAPPNLLSAVGEALETLLPLFEQSLDFEFGFSASLDDDEEADEDIARTVESVRQRFMRLTSLASYSPLVKDDASEQWHKGPGFKYISFAQPEQIQ